MYRVPTGPRIPHGSAPGLYALEGTLQKAFRAAAEELGTVLRFEKKQYFTHAVPEALYAFLDSQDQGAVLAAIRLWMKRTGTTTIVPASDG